MLNWQEGISNRAKLATTLKGEIQSVSIAIWIVMDFRTLIQKRTKWAICTMLAGTGATRKFHCATPVTVMILTKEIGFADTVIHEKII